MGPKLDYQITLEKNIQILEGILEIEMQEKSNNASDSNNKISFESMPWLSQDYLNIAQNADKIRYNIVKFYLPYL